MLTFTQEQKAKCKFHIDNLNLFTNTNMTTYQKFSLHSKTKTIIGIPTYNIHQAFYELQQIKFKYIR